MKENSEFVAGRLDLCTKLEWDLRSPVERQGS